MFHRLDMGFFASFCLLPVPKKKDLFLYVMVRCGHDVLHTICIDGILEHVSAAT